MLAGILGKMFSKQGNIMNVKKTRAVNKNASLAVSLPVYFPSRHRSKKLSGGIIKRPEVVADTFLCFQDAQAAKEEAAFKAKQEKMQVRRSVAAVILLQLLLSA